MPTKKRWYKFTRTPMGAGGKPDTHYTQLPHRLTIDQICAELENWAETWFGPNRAGSYTWTKIRKPPQAWLKKEIRRLQDKIENDRITLIQYYELLTGRTAHIARNTLSSRDLKRLNDHNKTGKPAERPPSGRVLVGHQFWEPN